VRRVMRSVGRCRTWREHTARPVRRSVRASGFIAEADKAEQGVGGEALSVACSTNWRFAAPPRDLPASTRLTPSPRSHRPRNAYQRLSHC
jgi:hypothetical protein